MDEDIQEVVVVDAAAALVALSDAAREGVARVIRLPDGALLAVVPIGSPADVYELVDAPMPFDLTGAAPSAPVRRESGHDRDHRGRR